MKMCHCGGCNHCSVSAHCPSVPLSCPLCPVYRVVQKCGKEYERKRFPYYNLYADKPRQPRKYKSWYDKNQKLICFLSQQIQTGPPNVVYLLLRLLGSQFGQILNRNGPDGMSYYLPLTGYCGFKEKSLFDCWGNVLEQFESTSVVRVFAIIRDYVHAKLRELHFIDVSKALKNGLLAFLGPDDPLVKLLKKINDGLEFAYDMELVLSIIMRFDEKLSAYFASCAKANCNWKNSYRDIGTFYNEVNQSEFQPLQLLRQVRIPIAMCKSFTSEMSLHGRHSGSTMAAHRKRRLGRLQSKCDASRRVRVYKGF